MEKFFVFAFILIVFLGIVGISKIYSKRKMQRVRVTSDQDFLSDFVKKYQRDDEAILSIRRHIAKTLSISPEVISLDTSFDDLKIFCGFVGEFELGFNDICDDLVQSRKRYGFPPYETFPETVSAYILEMLQYVNK